MKSKRMLLVLIAAFVVILGGAAVLYNYLSEGMDKSMLLSQNGQSITETDEEGTPGTIDAEGENGTGNAGQEAGNAGADGNAGQEAGNAGADGNAGQEAGNAGVDGSVEAGGAGTAGNAEVGGAGAAGNAEEEKVPAPDFTVVDADGAEVSLSDFVGKPVVLNFWASWCGPCKSEMPDFDVAYAKYGEEIHFVMVNMTDGSRETTEVAKAFIEEQGYSFPVYFDTESSAAIAYGVYSIPSTYFIDAKGNAVAQAKGAIDAETLEIGIEMILPE